MKVCDIMTRAVVSCAKDTDLGRAMRLMLEGRFGALPVIDTHGRLAGIITDRDIAGAVAMRQRNASHIAVHEAMNHTVRSCFEDDEINSALKQMVSARVRRLPVVDTTSHLTGILSIDDVVRHAVGHTNGVSAAEFVQALRMICVQPAIEPQFTVLDSPVGP